MFNVTAKYLTHAKIKYTELWLSDLLFLGLLYVKKFTSFCQVLNKMHTKENWFPFFCLTVYTQRTVQIILNSTQQGNYSN